MHDEYGMGEHSRFGGYHREISTDVWGRPPRLSLHVPRSDAKIATAFGVSASFQVSSATRVCAQRQSHPGATPASNVGRSARFGDLPPLLRQSTSWLR